MNPMGYSSLTEGNHREDVTREDLIRDYFYGGYTNLEICGILLLRHEIVISTQYKTSEKNIGDDGTKKTNAAKHC